MDQAQWDAHFRSLAISHRERNVPSVRLKELVSLYSAVRPIRRALDLACGAGANTLWLAEQGWTVTAVDRAPAAIELLQSEAARHGLSVTTSVVDLEAHQFVIEPAKWDLILMCRYLQIDLFEPARLGLAPGGLLIVIALLADPTIRAPQPFRVKAGELSTHFRAKPGFTILHEKEIVDSPDDFARRQATAEIVIQRDRD